MKLTLNSKKKQKQKIKPLEAAACHVEVLFVSILCSASCGATFLSKGGARCGPF